ncbi:group-specific protein [Bacillus aquiflavi]|uniref:Group-specific protein n=1 Tax=Bacillus aquiflavi TaxID=2672567 RepID=A0A7W2AE02_9BACI|nr:group-specific protein [Bacillus aquiflavi]MBA4535983.1 group-specific protein [Bacillus aquiflavi]UAC47726.1 group-specific protein [Bacillus aquiflavi]
MDIGWTISLIVTGLWSVIILMIVIPLDRKYVIRENRKINFKKTTIFLRWNVFDTLTLVIAIYTIICVQVLNMLLSFGKTIENPFVQFFTNQSQAWVIVTIVYLISRVSLTLKSIKVHLEDTNDENQ